MLLDYNLPKEKIAQFPKLPRDECKLMILKEDRLENVKFKDIINYLEKDDVIVLNDSKVLRFKLYGRRKSGGKLEILIVKKIENGYECLMRGKVSEGEKICINGKECKVVKKINNKYLIDLELSEEEIKRIGKIPLPPYIKNEVDEDLYQTIYAREEGSIAAPTAGLHFTSELLRKLEKKGVKISYITLHAGLSTFMNVVEGEYYSVSKEAAEMINNAEKVVAVGTTTMKALESSSKGGKVYPSTGWSYLVIDDGYKFQSPVKWLITNFHMPNSPPFKLVASFCGRERLIKAYKEALLSDYKFLSFGDAMLICSE